MSDTQGAFLALETAMQLEKDGYAFYTQAAEITADPQGRRMFRTLARDEQTHLTLLETAYVSLKNTAQWPNPKAAAGKGSARRRRLVFPKSAQAARAIAPNATELRALERGIKAEKDSIALYSRAARETTDPDGRAMYLRLVEQEKGHLTVLQGEYDYLTGSGFWLGFEEFDLEAAS